MIPAAKFSLPYRQQKSPLWSRSERMRVKTPSSGCVAGQMTTSPLNNIIGSRMQLRMAHPITWGGPVRCCHVDLVVIHALTTPSSPYLLGFMFRAIFAWTCGSFLPPYQGQEPRTRGGWEGSLYVVEWCATCALRHEPMRKCKRELTG